MDCYILNKNQQDSQSSENYEVHNEDMCNRLPLTKNRIFLGFFSNSHSAVRDAKAKYPGMAPDIEGCSYCCPESHGH